MKKNRLEAFSDGVFAIVITLLILNIKLPDVQYAGLQNGLLKLLPDVGVYVLSFLIVGMYWVFHHFSFTLIKDTDGVLIWLNIVFLLFISFMPFPAMLMGKYPYETMPMVIYIVNLMLANMCGFAMLIYLGKNRNLGAESLTDVVYRQQMLTYIIVNLMYVGCIFLAFIHPIVCVILIGAMTLFLIYRTMVLMGIGKCAVPAAE